jgi:hypothetical protein
VAQAARRGPGHERRPDARVDTQQAISAKDLQDPQHAAGLGDHSQLSVGRGGPVMSQHQVTDTRAVTEDRRAQIRDNDGESPGGPGPRMGVIRFRGDYYP